MRKPIPLLLFAVAFARVALAAPSAPIFPYPIHVDRLANGLTVVRIPFPSKGLVAFDTVVRVGSRNETEVGHTGFAHFFEHMMFRGTPRFPGSQRSDQLAALGFLDNAFTTDDLTLFTTYGPSSALESLIDFEADRFQHLSYTEAAFRTEALAVLGEYHKSAASPELKLAEALLSTAFEKHPYRHTTLGFYEDVKKMPEQYAFSREFFARWYTPDRVMVVVVGDFDDAQVMALVRKQYGDWKGPANRASDAVPVEPPQKTAKSTTVDWKSPTLPRLVNAWHIPAAKLDTTDAAEAQILGAYIAGSTSPLYKKAILDEQWAETVSADGEIHRDPSLFSFEAVLKSESARAPLQAALESEIKEIRAGKIDATRLKEIQSALRYGLLMQLDTADAIAERVAYYAGIFGSPDGLEKQLRALSHVTSAQLVAFARKHLVDTNRTSAAVKLDTSKGVTP
jgi:zinc protease